MTFYSLMGVSPYSRCGASQAQYTTTLSTPLWEFQRFSGNRGTTQMTTQLSTPLWEFRFCVQHPCFCYVQKGLFLLPYGSFLNLTYSIRCLASYLYFLLPYGSFYCLQEFHSRRCTCRAFYSLMGVSGAGARRAHSSNSTDSDAFYSLMGVSRVRLIGIKQFKNSLLFCFLLPYGSFLFSQRVFSTQTVCSLSTPLWEFHKSTHSKTPSPSMSLMYCLSTPLWEFPLPSLRQRSAEFLNSPLFLLPYGSFPILWTLLMAVVLIALPFYSLMGVSGYLGHRGDKEHIAR